MERIGMLRDKSVLGRALIGGLVFTVGCIPYWLAFFQWFFEEWQKGYFFCLQFIPLTHFDCSFFTDTLKISNREWATYIWVAIFFIWVFLKLPDVRKQISNLWKVLISKNMLILISLLSCYALLE